MQFHEVKYDSAQPVDGYGPGFFRVAGDVIQGGILLTEDTVKSWSGPDDLAPLLAMAGRIDVLLFGTGAEPGPPARSFSRSLGRSRDRGRGHGLCAGLPHL